MESTVQETTSIHDDYYRKIYQFKILQLLSNATESAVYDDHVY